MNYVSFEIAKKLKENGFKQPIPNFGQVWYNSDGQAILVSKIVTYDKGYTGFKKVICQSAEASHLQYDLELFDLGFVVFAPNLTDILYHVKDLECNIGFDPVVNQFDIAYHESIYFCDNPTEKLAELWLNSSFVFQ